MANDWTFRRSTVILLVEEARGDERDRPARDTRTAAGGRRPSLPADPRILADRPPPRLRPGLDRTRLERVPGRLDRHPRGGRQVQLGRGPRVPARRLVAVPLGVVDAVQQVPHGVRRVRAERGRARGRRAELDVPPPLRPVHVDHPLRGPDPVVLRPPRDLLVRPARDLDVPLHPGEVHPPLVPVPGRGRHVGQFFQPGPRPADLDRPPAVRVPRVVQSPVHPDRRRQPGRLPPVHRLAPVPVRLRQQQVPGRVPGVQLQFGVNVVVPVRVDEHLEVGVLEDHRVVRGQVRPDVRLLQLRGDVEGGVVPEHLDPGPEPRLRLPVPLDVYERVGPRGGGPGRVVEPAVDRDGRRGPVADVPPRVRGRRRGVGGGRGGEADGHGEGRAEQEATPAGVHRSFPGRRGRTSGAIVAGEPGRCPGIALHWGDAKPRARAGPGVGRRSAAGQFAIPTDGCCCPASPGRRELLRALSGWADRALCPSNPVTVSCFPRSRNSHSISRSFSMVVWSTSRVLDRSRTTSSRPSAARVSAFFSPSQLAKTAELRTVRTTRRSPSAWAASMSARSRNTFRTEAPLIRWTTTFSRIPDSTPIRRSVHRVTTIVATNTTSCSAPSLYVWTNSLGDASRNPVNTSIAPRAASGISRIAPGSSRTNASRNSPWNRSADLVRAPLSMFALLRTISEIIGRAPTNEQRVFATPTASRSRFWSVFRRHGSIMSIAWELSIDSMVPISENSTTYLTPVAVARPEKSGSRNAAPGSPSTLGTLTRYFIGFPAASPSGVNPRASPSGIAATTTTSWAGIGFKAGTAPLRNGKPIMIARAVPPTTVTVGLRVWNAAGMARI